MSETLFGIHGAALELRSQRMGLIASNIANAATPGYKARDIDFAAALKARIGGADEAQASQAATLYRVPVMTAFSLKATCSVASSTVLPSSAGITGTR